MNHRKFTRVTTHLHVDVEASGAVVSGAVRDIAFEGLWLPTATPLPEQTLCRVTIHLAEEVKIRANAEVVRSEVGGFAVHFLELLDLESYRHLRNVVLYNTRDTEQVEHELGDLVRYEESDSSDTTSS